MCITTSNINITHKISIKAPQSYYKFYNTYVSQFGNKETDRIIINSLCTNTLLPNIMPCKGFNNGFNNGFGNDTFSENYYNVTCVICYENIKNYIIVSNKCNAKHFVCYECFINYNYIKKQQNQLEHLDQLHSTKCPYCCKLINDNEYYILSKENGAIETEIYNLYNNIYNLNYYNINKNVSIKSVIFIKDLIGSLYKLKKHKSKINYTNSSSVNIVISKNEKWIEGVKYLINSILLPNTLHNKLISLDLVNNIRKIIFYNVNTNLRSIELVNKINQIVNKINNCCILNPIINIIIPDPLTKNEIINVNNLIDTIMFNNNVFKINRYQYIIKKTIDDNIYKKKIVII